MKCVADPAKFRVFCRHAISMGYVIFKYENKAIFLFNAYWYDVYKVTE